MDLVSFFKNYYTSIQFNHSDKESILEIQQQRFHRILRHAVLHSEFYHELYKGIDIENCQIQDLPVVTKSTMMANFDRIVTDKRLKLRKIQKWVADKNKDGKLYLGEFSTIPTSGSTGESALIVYHRKALDLIRASLFARYPLQTKLTVSDHVKKLCNLLIGAKARVAVIAMPRGNLLPVLRNSPAFHRVFVKLKIFSLFNPVDQIVAALNKFQPDCLITSSFLIAILAKEQLSGKLNIAFKRSMSFLAGIGEPLTEHTKDLAKKAWNMEIQDSYGATECYFMAASCQKFGQLHAMNDLCILEAVDGANNPVPEGKYGEKILITNLANFTQPIIRYEIEDIAGYAGQSCKCGLPFPTLLPVQGRTTEFLYFKKSRGKYVRFHPYRFIFTLYDAHELLLYQIVQTASNELTFLYVPKNEGGSIKEQLRHILNEALRQAGLEGRVTLNLKRVETIPRNNRSGKFQIVKSLGPPSDLDTELDTSTY